MVSDLIVFRSSVRPSVRAVCAPNSQHTVVRSALKSPSRGTTTAGSECSDPCCGTVRRCCGTTWRSYLVSWSDRLRGGVERSGGANLRTERGFVDERENGKNDISEANIAGVSAVLVECLHRGRGRGRMCVCWDRFTASPERSGIKIQIRLGAGRWEALG